ncbi:MAG: DUF6468 domain-containing protein [Rhodospirillaceae bacterium]
MSWQVVLDLTIIVLLVAFIVHALMLYRQLKDLRKNREEMIKVIATFNEATARAEAGVPRLRKTAEDANKSLDENVAKARTLRDDLAYMVDRADAMASRLESAVSSGRADSRAAEPRKTDIGAGSGVGATAGAGAAPKGRERRPIPPGDFDFGTPEPREPAARQSDAPYGDERMAPERPYGSERPVQERGYVERPPQDRSYAERAPQERPVQERPIQERSGLDRKHAPLAQPQPTAPSGMAGGGSAAGQSLPRTPVRATPPPALAPNTAVGASRGRDMPSRQMPDQGWQQDQRGYGPSDSRSGGASNAAGEQPYGGTAEQDLRAMRQAAALGGPRAVPPERVDAPLAPSQGQGLEGDYRAVSQPVSGQGTPAPKRRMPPPEDEEAFIESLDDERSEAERELLRALRNVQ